MEAENAENSEQRVNWALIERLKSIFNPDVLPPRPAPGRFRLPDLPSGVVPERTRVAQDASLGPIFQYLNQTSATRMGFLGYAYLSELAQIAEFRKLSERTAFEMTRKWVTLKSRGDDDKTDQIEQINEWMEKREVKRYFRAAGVGEALFGRYQLYIDIKDAWKKPDELAKPLALVEGKIQKGTVMGLREIEPITTFPYEYNSTTPLAPNFYIPQMWYVMAQKVHDSRMFLFVSRPVPNLLKPAYNFGGLSMSQLAIDTVERWLKTVSSVNRMISGYSTSGLKIDMGDALANGSGDGMLARVQLYTELRDNFNTMVLDKGKGEEFFQVNTPMTGLDKLQAQAQEHLAAIANMPLIVLTGITPSGLNASSEGEIRVYYDYVSDLQEILFRHPLTKLITLAQLDLFGKIDKEITFDFNPLFQMDEEKLARIRKSDADSAAEFIGTGVLSQKEVRQKVVTDPQSGYNGIDVNAKVPPPPNMAAAEQKTKAIKGNLLGSEGV